MNTLYIKLNNLLKHNIKYRKFVYRLVKLSILPFIVIYPITLIILYFLHNALLFDFIFKPLFIFLFISIIRKIINRERPYEHLKIKSIIKHRKGQSFPSRHTSCAFIIALMYFNISTTIGYIMIILALIVALSRLLGNLHYISDIIVGILISLIIYLI